MLLAVPRARPFLQYAVAAKLQSAPSVSRVHALDAASRVAREYTAPCLRLQAFPPITPAAGAAGAAAQEWTLPHPGIAQAIACYVSMYTDSPLVTHEWMGVLDTRIVIVSPVAQLSPGLLEAIRVPLQLAHGDDGPAVTAQLVALDPSSGVPPGPSPFDGTVCHGLDFHARKRTLSQYSIHAAMAHMHEHDVHAGHSCTLSRHRLVQAPMFRFQVKAVALQLLLALRTMHGRGIFVRDLKPENILVMSTVPMRNAAGIRIEIPVVHITDFGLAKVLQPRGETATIMSRSAGTLCYYAPEAARAGSLIDGRVDAFTVGTTVFNLMTGGAPLAAHVGYPERFRNVPGQLRNDSTGELSAGVCDALLTHFPAASTAQQWLQGATEADATMRLTIAELIAHDWLEPARTVLPGLFRTAGKHFDADGMAQAVIEAEQIRIVRADDAGRRYPRQQPSQRALMEWLDINTRMKLLRAAVSATAVAELHLGRRPRDAGVM